MKRRLVVLLGVLAAVLVPAIAAMAHAVLLNTSPADGDRLDDAPSEVTINFDEPVDLPPGSLRVFDDTGRRVDAGDPRHGSGEDQVRVSLVDDLGDGWFVATWSIVSADGHPLRGAFQFEVGVDQAAIDPSVLEEVFGHGDSTSAAVGGALVRWISYLGGLGASGAVLFSAMTRHHQSRLGSSRLRRLVRGLGIAGITASILTVPLFAIESSGLGLEAMSFRSLLQAAISPYGIAAAFRVVVLAMLLVTGPSLGRVMAGLGLAGIAGAETLAGHPLSTSPEWLMIPANAAHVASAAIWLGGLIGLIVTMRSLEGNALAGAHIVATFSRLALWTVAALAAAGLVMAWRTVGAPRALVSTAYGWTLIAKTAVVAGVVAIARYNRATLVPAIVGGRSEEAWPRLRRTVRLEASGLVTAIGLTALLVNIPPAAEVAGVSGAFTTTVDFGSGQINLVVDPNRAGVNQVHVYALDHSGLPTPLTGEVSLLLSMPHHDIGPLQREPIVAGPGHWILAGSELSIPGTWEITVRRTEGFDEDTVTIPVTVNP